MKLNAEPVSSMQTLGIPALFIWFIFLSLLQVFENERITFCHISKHDQRKIICCQQRKTMKLLIVFFEKQFNGDGGHWFMWQLGFSVGWCRNTSHEGFKGSLGIRSTAVWGWEGEMFYWEQGNPEWGKLILMLLCWFPLFLSDRHCFLTLIITSFLSHRLFWALSLPTKRLCVCPFP